jgi:hypothetical protein
VGDLWCYQFVSGDSEYVTVPDITELLGATAATWCAWVRKDASISSAVIAGDRINSNGEKKWAFGMSSATAGRVLYYVGDGTAEAIITLETAYTISAWHFVWMRFVGNSAAGFEAGCDSAVATPISTTSVAALGAVGQGHTYIGRYADYYNSITLGALTIWPSAISDAEISKWRNHIKRQLGL